MGRAALAALLLRIEGVLQTTRAAATSGFTVVSMRFLDGDGGARFLAVDDVRTIGGDQFVNGKDVLDALAPFDPNLLITGPPDRVAGLRKLAPGTIVRLEGLVDRGSRTFHLRDVFRAAEP
jgi:hypothetical protein